MSEAPRFVYPTSCPDCGSVDLVESDQVLMCKDCESYLQPRRVLSTSKVYELCAEYYALGLDMAQLGVKRDKLKAQVGQALEDWGAGKFEADGFRATFRPGRKSIDYKAIAMQLGAPEQVKALEPAHTKVGKGYLEIDGPKV